MNYDSYKDRPVEIATELINRFGTAPRAAAGHGDEPVEDPADFLRAYGLDPTGITAADARALADRLHDVFTVDTPAEAAAVLNGVLADAAAMPQISGHDGEDLHLHVDAAGSAPLDRLAATAAMGLAVALSSGGLRRFGRCDGIACRDVYVDASRNNRRRFCSDGCSNWAHVAAHRARQREAAGG